LDELEGVELEAEVRQRAGPGRDLRPGDGEVAGPAGAEVVEEVLGPYRTVGQAVLEVGGGGKPGMMRAMLPVSLRLSPKTQKLDSCRRWWRRGPRRR
jgi:hypothetical protein